MKRENLELRVGIFVIAALLILGGLVFKSGDFYLKPGYTLRFLFDFVSGVDRGAPVRLAGVDVGMVRQVSLSGREAQAEAVEIVFEVNASYAGDFREDSRAILAAEGLLGERYINISKGSPASPQIPSGLILSGSLLNDNFPVLPIENTFSANRII